MTFDDSDQDDDFDRLVKAADPERYGRMRRNRDEDAMRQSSIEHESNLPLFHNVARLMGAKYCEVCKQRLNFQ